MDYLLSFNAHKVYTVYMKQFTVVFPVSEDEGHKYILLGTQRPGKPLAGYLNGYGGKVEESDGSILEAAQRELKEELDIKLNNPKYIGSVVHQTKEIFFFLSKTDFIPHDDTEEMVENIWYDLEKSEFVTQMLPGDIEIIEHIRRYIDAYFNNEAVEEFKIIKEGQEINTAVQELNKSIGLK